MTTKKITKTHLCVYKCRTKMKIEYTITNQ